MEDKKLKVVIAGGGTTGWVTAYALAKRLGPLLDIRLVESEKIGTVGVGEATVPTMRSFHALLEIDEQEFMSATQGTFKLGIQFENWANIGDSYIHSFGRVGQTTWMTEFHAFWLEAHAHGLGGELSDYCLEWKAAAMGKCALKARDTEVNAAYHINATSYAQYLRSKAEDLGVKRQEGLITDVVLCPESGNITELKMDSGEVVEGDFFVDCTGFSSVLLGKGLGVEFEDWGHWLAADRAWATQSKTAGAGPPFTRARAHPIGWQWQIPVQQRTGEGIVYSSQFCSDDEARSVLVNNLAGPQAQEPYLLKFRTGRRREAWKNNCVAIGLASGFLEPLESTSIHLITTAVTRLMRLFPTSEDMAELASRYNAESKFEMEEVRNFLILHYNLTERGDTDFWRFYRDMDIPEDLRHRMDVFKRNGYIWPDGVNLFRVDSWLQVMIGQGLFPKHYHLAGGILGAERLEQQLKVMREKVARDLETMPGHTEFVEQYCPADMYAGGKMQASAS